MLIFFVRDIANFFYFSISLFACLKGTSTLTPLSLKSSPVRFLSITTNKKGMSSFVLNWQNDKEEHIWKWESVLKTIWKITICVGRAMVKKTIWKTKFLRMRFTDLQAKNQIWDPSYINMVKIYTLTYLSTPYTQDTKRTSNSAKSRRFHEGAWE